MILYVSLRLFTFFPSTGLVYAVGGFNGSLRVKTVDEYDPTRDTWTSIASMEARRSTLGVAVLNNRIYAVGGFDGSTGLNTAEVLDVSSTVTSHDPGYYITFSFKYHIYVDSRRSNL